MEARRDEVVGAGREAGYLAARWALRLMAS